MFSSIGVTNVNHINEGYRDGPEVVAAGVCCVSGGGSSLDRPGQKSRLLKESLAGYGFLIPWLIGFFGLTIIPMAYSLYLSFTNYNIFCPPKWIGLQQLHPDVHG